MRRFAAMLLISVILPAGCSPEQPVTGTPVSIYALGGPDDRSALAEHTLSLPEGMTPWKFALDAVLSGAGSPFPPDVKVTGSYLRDRVLSITLSEEAASLAGFSLTLAKACVVMTLTALDDGIDGVRISVEGQPAGSAVLRASDFVLGALVLADSERLITLFFPDETGLVRSESHTLVVRETDTVDWYLGYMLEAMISGPRTQGLSPVLPEGTRLLTVAPEGGGVYAVNFSAEFVTNAENNRVSHSMALHCLVRSVIAQPGVSAARLLVDGQPLERYGETDTSQPLTLADVRLP